MVHQGVKFSLRTKFIIFFSILIILVISIMAYMQIKREANLIMEKLKETGRAITHALAIQCIDPVIKSKFPLIQNYVRETALQNDSVSYIIVFDEQGIVLDHFEKNNIKPIYPELSNLSIIKLKDKITQKILKSVNSRSFNEERIKGYTSDNKETIFLEYAVPMLVNKTLRGGVRVGFSLKAIKQERARTLFVITIIALVSVIFCIILVTVLSHFVVHPIRKMVFLAKAIAEGDYDQTIDVKTGDELGVLSQAFNRMTINLKQNIEEKERQIYYLSSLHNLGNMIGKIFDLSQLLETIVANATKVMKCRKCSIMVLDEKTQKIKIKKALGLEKNADIISDVEPDRGGAITEWILKNKETLWVKDIRTDERFKNIKFDEKHYTTSSFIAVPLKFKDEVIGILSITEKEDGEEFTEEDVKLLKILAQQVVIAIDNAKVHAQDVERKRIEKELEIAHHIQMNMLPAISPCGENFSISAVSVPAKEVGGDYYDCLMVGDDKLILAIGDVSGKGVPAALLMVMIRTIIRAEAEHGLSTAQLISKLNSLLLKDIEEAMYATLFYAVLNIKERTLYYTNAGHNYPIIFHKDKEQYDVVKSTGFFVGMFDNPKYEEEKIKLKQGDLVVLYTDGITEAVNEKGEMFGLKRLCTFINQYRNLPVKEIKNKIFDKIEDFTEGVEQSDDITLVMVRIE